jgi:CRP/FNR family cyclic AMP-dependent transcriptional regulator
MVMEARALALPPRLSTLRFAAGERITAQGDPATSLYVVQRGIVKLTSISKQGRPAVLGLVGPGGMFGEQAVRSRGATTGHQGRGWATPAAIAVTDGDLAVVPLSGLTGDEDRLLLLESLAARLSEAMCSLERLLQHGAMARLAGVLAEMAGRFGLPRNGGFEITMPWGQHDLAAMVGASRETVNRSLSALRAMGWVDTVGRRLVIVDAGALNRFAEEGP